MRTLNHAVCMGVIRRWWVSCEFMSKRAIPEHGSCSDAHILCDISLSRVQGDADTEVLISKCRDLLVLESLCLLQDAQH